MHSVLLDLLGFNDALIIYVLKRFLREVVRLRNICFEKNVVLLKIPSRSSKTVIVVRFSFMNQNSRV
jgi:hypothetical protein